MSVYKNIKILPTKSEVHYNRLSHSNPKNTAYLFEKSEKDVTEIKRTTFQTLFYVRNVVLYFLFNMYYFIKTI